jgi:Ca2+-binding RTX toxin-like protein
VESGRADADGIEVIGLQANGATIRDAAGNDADLAISGGVQSGVLVDGVGPTVISATGPEAGAYGVGDELEFKITLSAPVTLNGSEEPAKLAVNIGSQTRQAIYSGGETPGATLTFTYLVQAGDVDADGITVASAVNLDGNRFNDADGNPAPLTGLSFSGLSSVTVDTVAPEVQSIAPEIAATADDASFLVTFSENVTGFDKDDLTLTTTSGTAAGVIDSVTPVDGRTYRVHVVDTTGDGGLRLDLKATGTGIEDSLGQAISGGFSTGTALTVDHIAPSGTDGTIDLNEDEDVTIEVFHFGFANTAAGAFDAVIIVTLPAVGELQLDGEPVSAGQAISVNDLEEGLLTYRPAPNANGDGYASFTFKVRDDAGGADTDPTPNTIVFDVRPINDAPVAANRTISVATGETRVLQAADFPFTDQENHALLSVRIATLPAAGVLKLNGVAVGAGDWVSAADIAAGKLVFAAAANAGTASFTFQVRDAGGGVTDTDTTPNTVTIQVQTPQPDPPPPPPPVQQETVDGVQIGTSTTTNPDGTTNAVITVPVVTPSRTETVGQNTVADIPLPGGQAAPDLLAQVPAGYGLQVTGPVNTGTAASSVVDLIREIQAHTDAASDRATLAGGGASFLGGLDPTRPLLVRTIVPTVGPGAQTGGPLVIQGSTQPDAPTTALVIDARSAPPGTQLQLQHVSFAAVVGSVTITGGEGAQTVWGDGTDQNIFLGADDDDLRGGAGADTVGSAGGDDRVQGDDGDDVVFGGEGADFVHGNAGADTVNGDAGNDVVYGGKGDDRVQGDAGDDRVFGDAGDDFVHGNAGADTVDGGAGADIVHGGQGGDLLLGGDGNDTVSGDLGDDVLQGGQGADYLVGGDGRDVIRGGRDDDIVHGGGGDDWIAGDLGNDTLFGGAGADTFHSFGQAGLDVVMDFNAAEGDRVRLLDGTAYTVAQVGADTVINMTGGARMVLAGVTLSSLADGWIGVG